MNLVVIGTSVLVMALALAIVSPLQSAFCLAIAVSARDDADLSHMLIILTLSEAFRETHSSKWWERVPGSLLLSPLIGFLAAVVGLGGLRRLRKGRAEDAQMLLTMLLSIILAYLVAESVSIGSGLISLLACGVTLAWLGEAKDFIEQTVRNPALAYFARTAGEILVGVLIPLALAQAPDYWILLYLPLTLGVPLAA